MNFLKKRCAHTAVIKTTKQLLKQIENWRFCCGLKLSASQRLEISEVHLAMCVVFRGYSPYRLHSPQMKRPTHSTPFLYLLQGKSAEKATRSSSFHLLSSSSGERKFWSWRDTHCFAPDVINYCAVFQELVAIFLQTACVQTAQHRFLQEGAKFGTKKLQ